MSIEISSCCRVVANMVGYDLVCSKCDCVCDADDSRGAARVKDRVRGNDRKRDRKSSVRELNSRYEYNAARVRY